MCPICAPRSASVGKGKLAGYWECHMANPQLTKRTVGSLRAAPDERLELFDQDGRGSPLRVSPTGN